MKWVTLTTLAMALASNALAQAPQETTPEPPVKPAAKPTSQDSEMLEPELQAAPKTASGTSDNHEAVSTLPFSNSVSGPDTPEKPAPTHAASTPLVQPTPTEPVVTDAAEPEPEAAPEAEPIEGPYANVPLPVAMTETLIGTCLPALRGGTPLVQALPADAAEGIGDTISERLITRPQAGQIWTTHTLEGEMLLGVVEQRPGACQVLGVSPLGELVMEEITNALTGLDSAFEIVDETGTDSGTPIHWRRLRSSEGEFIDVLHYKGVPGGRASTLHVIVG